MEKDFITKGEKIFKFNNRLHSKLFFSDLEKFQPKMAKNMQMFFKLYTEAKDYSHKLKFQILHEKVEVRFTLKFACFDQSAIKNNL